MVDGRLDIEMRASLAFYFIRRMNLDLAEAQDLSPERLLAAYDPAPSCRDASGRSTRTSCVDGVSRWGRGTRCPGA